MAHKTNNTKVKEALSDLPSLYDAAEWVKDIIRGSLGQISSSSERELSQGKIFYLLRTIDVITTSTVGELLNKQYQEKMKKDLSTRQIQKYTKICCNASSAIQLQMDKGESVSTEMESFNYRKDAIGYLTYKEGEVFLNGMTRPFTEDEREVVRYLSIKGTTEELNLFIESLKNDSKAN
ncbi:hypothetical protein OLJ30_001735 [Salmonella enterica]|nr:hypothetical protein [Salmonella enterica subsp. enterica]EDF9497048.1 hypothetical protein [Salmonella enterica]EIK5540467.1 hypothetical protein [Salmonella enterica]EJD7846788.1 hypothetical protein [Salmonella enterica]EKA4644173.1 hypothetical protein [Salmonella enterica]